MDLFCNLIHFAFKLSLHECLTLVQSLNINAQGKKEDERNPNTMEGYKKKNESVSPSLFLKVATIKFSIYLFKNWLYKHIHTLSVITVY